MKLPKTGILAATLWLMTAVAQAAEAPKANDPLFMIAIEGGYNSIPTSWTEFLGARLGYRLPVDPTHWQIFVDYSYLPGSNLRHHQYLLAGGQYHFLKSGPWDAYASLAAGTSIGFAIPTTPGGTPSLVISPAIIAGVGADYMFTPNFGIGASLQAGWTIFFRPGLMLKYCF